MLKRMFDATKHLGARIDLFFCKLFYSRKYKKIEDLPESHYYKSFSFYSVLSLHKNFLKSSGWLESKYRNQSSRNGFPIPWITYPSFEILDRMQLKKLTIVEFGAGASTIYFASRALKVISYEFDSEYLATLEKGRQANTTLRGPLDFPSEGNKLEVDNRYSDFLNQDLAASALSVDTANKIDWTQLIHDIKISVASADIVFIDGGPRTLVAKICSEVKLQTQLVILDNSDRKYEQFAASLLEEEGYVEIPFTGLGPLNTYSWTTSFFVREISTLRNIINP